ncbi:MAG: hypothetical protein M1825_005641 [Sarcosagium campestre]|nr:MAG: hypothetical protein M1825_005641 [Sarcosagium campestre]
MRVILLSTHVKFAPFAARQRRGYVRDASERDLAAHLETALRGVIIGDRWPKSGVDVVVTVLEGEDEGDVDHQQGSGPPGIGGVEGWGMMAVLAGCITAASAAIVDAGIDCVDLVSGGVAALVVDAADTDTDRSDTFQRAKAPSIPRIVLDPSPSEHERIVAACVVGYLSSRDEITEMWMRGEVMQASQGVSKGSPPAPLAEELVDQAVHAACGARLVLAEAVKESASWKLKNGDQPAQPSDNGVKASSEDVVMA